MRFRTIMLAVALETVALQAGFAGSGEPVDVNHASVTQLMQVKGMTVTWAARIVRFRPYRTKLDLLEEGVVTAEVYRRIREGIIAHRSN